MARYSRHEAAGLDAYATPSSAEAGQTVHFHVSVKVLSAASVQMEIYGAEQLVFDDQDYGSTAQNTYEKDYRRRIHVGQGAVPVFCSEFPAESFAVPEDAAQNGCGWPANAYWEVPSDLESGVYFARFKYRRAVTYVLVVVRPGRRSPKRRIVCQIPQNTHQAYNPWGGGSLYPPPISKRLVNPISFDRPCQLWDFILYDAPIVLWLLRNFEVDFCTNLDLHRSAGLLSDYNLFVSCGHDEYWSSEMRMHVEKFTKGGGNVLFLSGNTCYRPARFESDGRMGRPTLEVGDWGNPEAYTTGLSFSAGRWSKPLIKLGFRVVDARHWAFRGTGLANGQTFGQSEGIIGYETDAATYDLEGKPVSPTPQNFKTLATAFLPKWEDWYGRSATFGMWQAEDRGGTVVAAGTTGWGRGLLKDSGVVHTITHNLVSRLAR